MKIWVGPLRQRPEADRGFTLPRSVWQRLPSRMPGVVFDQSSRLPDDADVQLSLYGAPTEETPAAYCFLGDIDNLVFPAKSWWPFSSSRASGLPQQIADSAAIFVPHRRLAGVIQDNYRVKAALHVTGHGLPEEVSTLSPADSVTRRITREVYGREKSFFLAPSTGHTSDNLKRLVQAYDQFRRRCPEEVILIIGGTEKAQLRSVRRAVKTAEYRGDITYLPQLSSAERWKIYSSARAILYPSLSTRFPVEILKAWHARVPVMAVDNDVLMGGGAQVQGEDVKSMAEALTAIVTTPFLASGLVDNGTRRLADFTWEKVTERVAEVLREVEKNTLKQED